ncbi:MAG: hypothetical protein QNJ46_20495 [Leptolyngbyaceae cyanobacterium MO_188.B28]|nr:hypothetical protein [Leptolyngbyaceae cyanobacterium MO_188.B28]
MNRLLYEKSVSYKGFLIIPSVYRRLSGETLYTYRLLADIGHKSSLHQADNSAGLYSSAIEGIVKIAKAHLNTQPPGTELTNQYGVDHFKHRYTYRHNLIIVAEAGGKIFYDHYPPFELRNIAAPRIFTSPQDCMQWVKQGLDRNQPPVKDDSPFVKDGEK